MAIYEIGLLSSIMESMGRRIIFLRHGKLELPYESHDDMPFEVLRSLGTQTMDPPSDIAYLDSSTNHLRTLLNEFRFSTIFRSPSLRCSTLEQYIHSITPQPIPPAEELEGLREIWFDLNKLFPSQNASVKDIAPKLIAGLLAGDPGIESVENISRRLKDVTDHFPQSGDVLILTHGFLMRFIISTEKYSDSPKELTRAGWEAIPKFGYLEGFNVEEGKPLRYI